MSRRPKPSPPQPAERPFHDAFAALRDLLPPGHVPRAPPPASPRTPTRAVVRLERKGRGGKEATVVEKLELSPAELSSWADDLKRALGCGGGVEGSAVVVQGDQRERVARWLSERGVPKVVRG
ncbi:MAG TPA: translation initiation factor [Anaeromyxobacter sp.]|nr:translation initiation factor [Anaeromyxobacter sp.]